MRGVRGSGRALRRLRLRLRRLRRLLRRWLLRQLLLRRRQLLLRRRRLVWALLLARAGGVEAASAPRRLLDGCRRDSPLAQYALRVAPPGEGEG